MPAVYKKCHNTILNSYLKEKENNLKINKKVIYVLKKDGYIEGENLFTVPYDWRLSMENSVLLLNKKINEAKTKSKTGKVNVIAHSMGGLLFKEYLLKYSNVDFHKIIFSLLLIIISVILTLEGHISQILIPSLLIFILISLTNSFMALIVFIK